MTPSEGRPDRGPEDRARAAEERLRNLERRFQSTVARVVDGILVVDAHGRILFTNPAGERIFGRSAGELIGSELGIPVVSGDTTQIDLRTPSGSRVVELRVASTTWEEKQALLLSVRDITERRQAEARERHLLMEQLARMQAEEAAARASLLAEASRLLAATRDEDAMLSELAKLVAARIGDRCLVDVSADPGSGRYRKIAARRSAEGGGELTRCVDGDGTPIPLGPLARRIHAAGTPERVTDPGDSWIDEAASAREDRELWSALTPGTVVVAPIRASWGPLGTLAVSSSRLLRPLSERDVELIGEVALRTGLALENARLLQRAEEASRAKSDFLAIISHELRTPLTGITGYASLLTEEIERPLLDKEKRYVEGILRCSDRLLKLIDQILLFARSRSGQDGVRYRTLALGELVDEVVKVARPVAEDAGLRLVSIAPDRQAPVTTDVGIVRHILLHLLTNAIKFTREGTVTLEAEVQDGGTILCVRDTGLGIPEDKVRRIFEPFAQAESPHTREVGGTGIGLNVVQNLVRLLGGDLSLESEPGRGSTFTVRLPPHAPQART